MRFHADLHIHSKYSRACSKDCDLEHLAWWARRKGVNVVGTGDFTHPAWFDHLRDNLVPAEPGLFRLRDEVDRDVTRRLPPTLAAGEVRFMLSVEISTIYKRADRTRKVHHLVYVPDLDAAADFNTRLGRIGNLGSDGRPILGLDSRDLLEITLEVSDGAYLVPAHVWTPWFAVLGSKSGFDAVDDCYADLADHIFALETGLSSDPAMNWRISALDRYRLVSSSDAHSPPILGREATVFDTDLDYFAIRRAMATGTGLAGTVEFFPEEGKYHVDGHRGCGVRLEPHETRRHGGSCPSCEKPVTVGVLSRVEELADRDEGHRPSGAAGFRNLVPLPEIMSEIVGTGPKSKKVVGEIDTLTATFGPELTILQDTPADDIAPRWPLLAEAVTRLRRGEVIREAGYDGEYGVIRLFEPGELRRAHQMTVPALFEDALFDTGEFSPAQSSADPPSLKEEGPIGAEDLQRSRDPGEDRDVVARIGTTGSVLDGLDPDQRAAAEMTEGPLLILAGPGTGKTRTLTHRLAHLVTAHDVAPEHCLALTFTRRAAEEMHDRLAALVPEQAAEVTVATFHALGVRVLREHHERLGLSRGFGIADEAQQLGVLVELTGSESRARRLLARMSAHRRQSGHVARADRDTTIGAADGVDVDLAELTDLTERYIKELRQRDLVDFDDLVALPVTLVEDDPDLVAAYRDRFQWVCVDEYQDVDDQQYRLLRLLVPPDGNITAIGDPDQAVYGFRGANVGFFLRFRQDFPSARTVLLTRNYRSSAPVLTAALQAIAPTTLVPGRALQPCGDHGDAPVGVHAAASEQDEASFVTRTVEQLLGGTSFHSFDSGRTRSAGSESIRGLGFSDFAILYRTDRQARAVMESLTRAGMPFQKRSHDRLAERPGVPEIVAELSGPPAPTSSGVADPVRQATGTSSGGSVVAERVRQAAAVVLGLGEVPSEGDRPAGDAAAEIHSAVELLMPLAERCGDDLDGFRTELALGVEVDTWDPRADRISLLTLHAAKGLEFPVVFVVGCEDGLLPLRWPGQPGDGAGDPDEEHVREERRLLFVGMTRAQQHLYLCHAAERSRQGAVRKAGRSPFLADLDPASYEQIGEPTPRRQPRDTQLRLL